MPDNGRNNAGSQITELKVSGHTMALEPGLYCVFNAPDGPAPSGDSGLPGVRITAGPGRREGQVSVAGFQADGWIGSDSAALVRVVGSAAEILVTVYQGQDSKGEAPKLQVVKLSGDAAQAPGTPAIPGPQATAPRGASESVEVVAHIYARGDVGGRLGDWMGEPGSNRWIEGFGIAPAEGVPAADIEYQAVLGRGWLSPWSEGGQFCGSRGMSLPILGLRVRLRGASAGTHSVVLHASFVDGTKIGPVGDGEPCEAPSLAALEAFQVTLRPNEAKAGKAGRGRAQPEPVAAPVEAPASRRAKPAAKAAKAGKPAPKAPEPEPAPAPKPAARATRKPATTRRR